MQQGCHHFLDSLPRQSEWLVQKGQEATPFLTEDQKLELSLGPPGVSRQNPSRQHFPDSPCLQNCVLKPPRLRILQLQSGMSVMEESSQPSGNSVPEEEEKKKTKKAFSTAVPNSSSAKKRTASSHVVGWPPIRSFRKNSGSSSKLASESTSAVPPDKVSCKELIQNCSKSLFVKINMDGIPIGRKVNLKAFDSYEKLSCAVNELFRDLLAAHNNRSADEGGKMSGGLLNNYGEYTLVYEDNEGDRMLVGDVPWHMFVSTVKRLHALKSSELPTLSRKLFLSE